MRVVVHHPARIEQDASGAQVDVPESVSAYRLGRIDDFTNPLTGETTPKDEVAAVLLEEAKAEYPDCEVKIEYLVNDDETGETASWLATPAPEGRSPGGGKAVAQELHVEQAAEAGGGDPQ